MRSGSRRTERGQTLPLVALCMVFLMIAAAFGVDLGTLMAQKRKMQSVADLVAMDTIRVVNGSACNAIQTSGQTLASDMNTAATASALRNGFTVGGTNVLNVEPGTWDGTTFTSFGTSCSVTPAGLPGSVRITAQGTTKYGFAKVVGISSGTTSRNSVAARTGRATWLLGSSLADMSANFSLLNPLMTGLLGGSTLTTSLISYQGLATSSVSLAALATQLGLNLGNPSNLLNTSVNMKSFLTAVATVLSNNGNSSASATVATLAASISALSTLTTNLGNFVKLGTGVNGSAADAQLNVFELITGSAEVANGSSFVNIPGLSLTAGITNLTVSFSAIQPQVICVMCSTGDAKTTSQVTLKVTPTISPVSLLGLASPVTVSGQVPLVVTAGSATGTTGNIQCDGSAPGFTVGVQPQAASTSTTLSLAASLILGVTTLSTTGAAVQTAQPLYNDFFANPSGFDVPQHNGNTTIGFSGITYGSTNVSILALNVAVTGVSLANALGPVLGLLDTQVISPLMKLLGLDVGGADTTGKAMTCTAPALVK